MQHGLFPGFPAGVAGMLSAKMKKEEIFIPQFRFGAGIGIFFFRF